MTIKELKNAYFEYFEAQSHTRIPSASLIPDNDPTVLFTTAGMQPLVPYLLGEPHPGGTRLVDAQKCIRTGDIEEVGDNTHLTFFEMLGNWSLGDYWKRESITWSFEFLTKKLGVSLDKLAVTCFVGEEGIERDEESAAIWRELGIADDRIVFLGREDNWWGPAGQTGPCGPDTEIFYWTGEEPVPAHYDPSDKRWVEIWNNVFMQYNKTASGTYEPLVQRNVDTGMGAERTAAVLSGKQSVYEIEPLSTLVMQVAALRGLTTDDLDEIQLRAARIIADHIRAATFMLAEGIEPSNVERGYVLRRLIRRAIRYARQLGITDPITVTIAEVVIAQMSGFYSELRDQRDFITDQLIKEEEKFSKTLEKGIERMQKLAEEERDGQLNGVSFFSLFTTHGFPVELSMEIAREKRIPIEPHSFEKFQDLMNAHQELSRTASAGKFKGGLADHSTETTRLHTATHLMLEALRRVVGTHVQQKGSNITADRLRFDFTHADKLTPEQIAEVERIVNEQIDAKLPVEWREMSVDEAKELGATGVFEHKYGDRVKVYIIGEQVETAYSKEICGGPHVTNTGELGKFKIQKEESSSSGVRRIKAVLE